MSMSFDMFIKVNLLKKKDKRPSLSWSTWDNLKSLGDKWGSWKQKVRRNEVGKPRTEQPAAYFDAWKAADSKTWMRRWWEVRVRRGGQTGWQSIQIMKRLKTSSYDCMFLKKLSTVAICLISRTACWNVNNSIKLTWIPYIKTW